MALSLLRALAFRLETPAGRCDVPENCPNPANPTCNPLDHKPPARRFAAQPRSGYRSIRKCDGRRNVNPERGVGTNLVAGRQLETHH